jgi:lipopolysaccharide/colanic/teichoic acid biosynthesis glycosyltransferase
VAHAVVPAAVPAWKRILDVSLTLGALPLLVPLSAAIALVIKCVSRGPVLFRQERIGLKGKPFICLKFRTMRVNAPTTGHQAYLATLMKSDQPMTKMDSAGDPRLIPMGSILRSMGLDELPQLINVLRGEMSIVGPRPCLRYEYESYEPWQKQRFNSLPGLTGLWQVSGKNKTTFDQMIRMDIRYAETRSPGLDLVIMFKTVPVLAVQAAETLRRRLRRQGNAQGPSGENHTGRMA